MLWLDTTLVSTMSNKENSNNYYRIVYLLNDIRLIRCRDDLQWTTANITGGGYWRGHSY